MKNSTILWIIVLVVVAGAVGWYVTSRQGTAPPPSGQTANNVVPQQGSQVPDANTTGGAPTSATVVLSANGFSPASVTVKKGGTVVWTNEGSGAMWVAVDNHPTHTHYDGTTRSSHCPDTTNSAFDQCASGNNFSFVFDKVGTWRYHNHANAGQSGTVIVVE
jgi:plastocyanin